MIKQVKMLLNKHTTGFRRILAMTVLILFALLMSAFITGSSVAGIIPSATIILAIFYYSSEILLKLRKMDGQFTYLISHQAHDIKDINYREIESLINLRHYIKLRHPIWGLRGFASSPDFLFHIYRIICERKPQTVLELGSGVSTVIASYGLEANGVGRCISIDHLQEYADETTALLFKHELSASTSVRLAPLETLEIGNQKYQWYSSEGFRDIPAQSVDLLIVDGPPEKTCRYARYPALTQIGCLLRPGAIVLFDDSYRSDEKWILDKWKDAFPGCSEHWIPSEKGLVALKIPS